MKTIYSFLTMLALLLVTTVASAQPTTAAPTPPDYAEGKVISIFSDAYTSLEGVNFNPNWGQSTAVSNTTVGEDNLLVYSSVNYQGTEFAAQNLTSMDYMHIDVWTADETNLRILPISETTGEKPYSLTPVTTSDWTSFDIPLQSFIDQGLSMTDIFQLKVDQGTGGTVYFDNIYFYDTSTEVDSEVPTAVSATVGTITGSSVELSLSAEDNSGFVTFTVKTGDTELGNTTSESGVAKVFKASGLEGSTEYTFTIIASDATGNAAEAITAVATTIEALAVPTSAAPVPTHAPENVIPVFSDTYDNSVVANYNPGWGQRTVYTTVEIETGNSAVKLEGINYQGMEFSSKISVSHPTLSAEITHLHIDVWSANDNSTQVTPIGAGETLISLTPFTLLEWNSFDIPLTDFSGVTVAEIMQMKYVSATGNSPEGADDLVIYLDNIYFYKQASSGIDEKVASLGFYPNPTSGVLYLNTEQIVSVYNMSGQLVKQLTADSGMIDISDLAPGVYSVKVGEVITKVIKE